MKENFLLYLGTDEEETSEEELKADSAREEELKADSASSAKKS